MGAFNTFVKYVCIPKFLTVCLMPRQGGILLKGFFFGLLAGDSITFVGSLECAHGLLHSTCISWLCIFQCMDIALRNPLFAVINIHAHVLFLQMSVVL